MRRTFPRLSAVFLCALVTWPLSVRAADCNSNGVDDTEDIGSGASRDCNANAIPDECDLSGENAQFETALRYEVGRNADEVVASDFDGDGDVDLAISVGSTFPGLSIALNQGDLEFDTVEIASQEERLPEFRALGLHGVDFDGDGRDDLLAELRLGTEIAWAMNNGDGSFAPASLLDVEGEVSRFATGDIDGDGDQDVLASVHDRGVAVVLGDGRGGLELLTHLDVPRSGRLVATDFDGDGADDVAVASRGTDEEPQGYLHVFLSEGDGSFRETPRHEVGVRPTAVQSADLDSDGIQDLVVLSYVSKTVSIFLGVGDGTFEDRAVYPGGFGPVIATITDLDADGDLDLAVTGASPDRTEENLVILRNDGAGGFDDSTSYPIGEDGLPVRIEAADLNGDGRLDLAIENYRAGEVAIFQNTGGADYERLGAHEVSHGAAHDMAIADFDEDGDLDIATVSIIALRGLSVLENITGGEFERGCGEFLRGDVNVDGSVSAADIVMLRRFLFQGLFFPPCADAADATDNDELTLCDAVATLDVLFRTPDWSLLLPAPSLEPGIDPTVFPEPTGDEWFGSCTSNTTPDRPLGCAEWRVTEPVASADVLSIGDVAAEPGETVLVPVTVSADVPVDAIQLVIEYDMEQLDLDPEGVVFEDTYFDGLDNEMAHPAGLLTVHPESGVATLLVSGNLILPGAEIPPGDDITVVWLTVTVSPDATPGTTLDLTLTNGPSGEGVGPYKLRNEIVHEGASRYASLLPELDPGLLAIVGDQSFFIRADSNTDRRIDVSDAIFTLSALFLGGSQPRCEDAADANDDGSVDISDASITLNYLFLEAPSTLPAPHGELGFDPTDDDLAECRYGAFGP